MVMRIRKFSPTAHSFVPLSAEPKNAENKFVCDIRAVDLRDDEEHPSYASNKQDVVHRSRKDISHPTALPSTALHWQPTPRAWTLAYVLFLEFGPRNDAETFAERMTWRIVQQFETPAVIAPQIAHCELLVPPVPHSAGGRVHFGTYMGSSGAKWQNRTLDERDDGINFYLVHNGARWRALPVVLEGTLDDMRRVADRSVGAPYSIAMYATSAPYLRRLSFVWPNASQSPGHCAVITARILSASNVVHKPRHAAAWYSPASLYNDLYTSIGNHTSPHIHDHDALLNVDLSKALPAVAALLHGPLQQSAHNANVDDNACRAAVSLLSHTVFTTSMQPDVEKARIAQMELATELLKWVLIRTETEPSTLL